ncbi:MAG: TerD family protein [Planctomycetia bacterium]|nr:TerD family protein [Planctomycetia bacterium]
MAISLVKGENVKFSSGLKVVQVGLGWTVRETNGADFDLDACCFLVGENGKVRSDDDFIFYNQLKSKCGSVEHMGDNQIGGDGCSDAEMIMVHLEKVPTDVVRLIFTVAIHEARERGQNFGMVNAAFIRVVDSETKEEIARFDLSEDASTNTSMIFGEIYKRNNEWKFKAIGQGFNNGLLEVAQGFGVHVSN